MLRKLTLSGKWMSLLLVAVVVVVAVTHCGCCWWLLSALVCCLWQVVEPIALLLLLAVQLFFSANTSFAVSMGTQTVHSVPHCCCLLPANKFLAFSQNFRLTAFTSSCPSSCLDCGWSSVEFAFLLTFGLPEPSLLVVPLRVFSNGPFQPQSLKPEKQLKVLKSIFQLKANLNSHIFFDERDLIHIGFILNEVLGSWGSNSHIFYLSQHLKTRSCLLFVAEVPRQ